MRSLRRPDHETRVEIMPLIDVIFLLLTFFIYAMVLMVRAELLPVEMHSFASGEPATLPPAVAITIDRNGTLFFNREQIAMNAVLARLKEIKADDPETVIYVAAEATGSQDRLPVFLDLYDTLSHAGLDIKLVGSPEGGDQPSAIGDQP
ncbi:MAG: ExbD/TolR family protein [Planctomycetota bacterium]|jgi:biopolymer transport protein ExbD